MTTRLKGVAVCFDRDLREDDAEGILNAIRMIRGVASVAPVESRIDDWLARQRVRHELLKEIIDLFNREGS